MGLPTYEYPPSVYPVSYKYTDSGQCTHCGYKYVLKEDDFACKICNCKMNAGIEIDNNVYYHGDDSSSCGLNESNDCVKENLTIKNREVKRRNFISIYVYPPKTFPMKAIYIKRKNGVCVNCKNKVLNSIQCSKCKIKFCYGIEFKSIIYYHGRILMSNRSYDESYLNRNSEMIGYNLILDSDSSIHLGKKFCQTKRCFISLLALIIVISILIIVFVILLKRSF
jgi:hypothetical protein